MLLIQKNELMQFNERFIAAGGQICWSAFKKPSKGDLAVPGGENTNCKGLKPCAEMYLPSSPDVVTEEDTECVSCF